MARGTQSEDLMPPCHGKAPPSQKDPSTLTQPSRLRASVAGQGVEAALAGTLRVLSEDKDSPPYLDGHPNTTTPGTQVWVTVHLFRQ